MSQSMINRKGVWNHEQRRRVLSAANHLRKTLISTRSRLLNALTLTPIPRFMEGVQPGKASTSCVIDYPRHGQPTDGQLFPLSSKDLAASVSNETAFQLGSLMVSLRIDVHGERARSVEKDLLTSKDITVGEITEDVASFLRLMQDRPLGQNEDFLMVSMATKNSYLAVPRDRNDGESFDTDSPKREFSAKNYPLAVRNNVTDRDIESAVLANVDELAKLNNVPFPDNQAKMAKEVRSRFRSASVAHAVANMKSAKLGAEKELFRVQPSENTKLLDLIMEYRSLFPDPSQMIVLHVEVVSAKDIHMEELMVDYLRIPRWEGLPSNPVGFRNRATLKISPDAGN